MAARNWIPAAVLTAAMCARAVPIAHAQAAPTDVEATAAYQITGVVNADKVYVRSGAGENDYPVMRLNKGETVTVLGEKFDWLKILPPPDAYCVIGKAFVERRGEGGKTGRVIDAANIVKVGSLLNDMKAKVVGKLEVGTDVQVIEEQNEFLKIAPPVGTVLYIHKKFVDPVKIADAPVVDPQQPKVLPESVVPPTPAGNDGATAGMPATTLATAPVADGTPAGAVPPATAPAGTAAAAEMEFDAIEADLYAAAKVPPAEQPLDALIARYQKLFGEKKLPESMLRVCEIRITSLKARSEAYAQYKEMETLRAAKAQEIAPVRAEGEEMAKRIEANSLKRYAAVGTLRASALQMGGRPLLRLTDPATGRTVVYVRTDDAAVLANVGQFVGVTGPIASDARLQIKFVTPSATTVLDPTAVTSGAVLTELSPASLIPVTAGK